MHGNVYITMITLRIFKLHGQNTGVAANFRYENCIDSL